MAGIAALLLVTTLQEQPPQMQTGHRSKCIQTTRVIKAQIQTSSSANQTRQHSFLFKKSYCLFLFVLECSKVQMHNFESIQSRSTMGLANAKSAGVCVAAFVVLHFWSKLAPAEAKSCAAGVAARPSPQGSRKGHIRLPPPMQVASSLVRLEYERRLA